MGAIDGCVEICHKAMIFNPLRDRYPKLPTPTPRPEDRRRTPRYAVSLNAQIRVLLPEQSGATLVAKVTIENLSVAGARVHVPEIKKEHVPVFIRARRKCSLICQLPGSEVPSVLSGEIAWIDIHHDALQHSAHLDVELLDTPPEEKEHLARFLDQLAAKSRSK